MGNLGGGEMLVILLVALIVLGPTKLPPAVRQVGKFVGEIRRIGQGFQQELREATKPIQETTTALKTADKKLRTATQQPFKEMQDTMKSADPRNALKFQSASADKAEKPAETGSQGDAADKDAEPDETESQGDADSGPDAAGAPPAAPSPTQGDDPDRRRPPEGDPPATPPD